MANPGTSKTEILKATQKLLDRILFCTFAENRGLLPPKTITDAYAHRDKFNPKSIWETNRGLFRSINKHNPLSTSMNSTAGCLRRIRCSMMLGFMRP